MKHTCAKAIALIVLVTSAKQIVIVETVAKVEKPAEKGRYLSKGCTPKACRCSLSGVHRLIPVY